MMVQAPTHPKDFWIKPAPSLTISPASSKGSTTWRASRGSLGTAHCHWKGRRTMWLRNYSHFRERRVTLMLKVMMNERPHRKQTGEKEAKREGEQI